ncbi:MAG: hypothetical protein M0P17_09230 [Methanoculleus sp.]|nr:hypothetical protein [Methanoculleus sp.]
MAGVVAAIGVFSLEFVAFVSSIFSEEIIQTAQDLTTNPSVNVVISGYMMYILLFGIIGILEDYSLGVMRDWYFTAGFISSNFLLLVAFAPFIWPDAPDVGVGMITSLIVVCLGQIRRLVRNQAQHPHWDY